MIKARVTSARVPVMACNKPPLFNGSVGVAIDMSEVKRLREMPGRPFCATVNKILAIGITVTIAPNATKELMNARDAAKRLITKMSPGERHIQREKYKSLRNRATASLRNDRKREVEEGITLGKNPWKIADRILKRETKTDLPLVENGKTITNDKDKAELMNQFFVEKVKELRSRINADNDDEYIEKFRKKTRTDRPKFSVPIHTRCGL